MEITQRVSLPLNALQFGHEANPPINARVVGRAEAVQALSASILAHGLIHALSVKDQDGTWYVADGNRRLAALRHLAEQGSIPSDWQVKCDPLAEGQTADEISLAANFERVPLHEADQYAKFYELTARGLKEKAIAQRFGIDPKRVGRMLALGRLSPKIIDWWREQEISNQVIEVVRAFTLAPSIEEQERVFESTLESGRMWAHSIREAFGAGDHNAKKLLTFVGTKAFRAAGGSVIEDLFGENNSISDPALLARLADNKMRAKADELEKDGWSWVALGSELPDNWRYYWSKLPEPVSDEDKARSGAVVHLDHDGKLEVRLGVLKPAPATATSRSTGESETNEPSISNAMSDRLSVQATNALRVALADEGRIGLVALLAGFLSGATNAPVKVKHEGHGRTGGYDPNTESFTGAFNRLAAMTDEALFSVAAGIAAQAIDLTSPYAPAQRGFRPPVRTLADAIDGNRMYVALRDQCDFKDYFAGISKPLILKAISEAVNEDEARKAGALKKAELVAFAVKNVPPTGWLPPQLRTASYPMGDIDDTGELVQAAENK
ncbi:ParB/Srx family N-terminal domain-containing protein [Aminobacter sp. MDW-2]|uniref:ParB/RepB/Spo0J family partition protein n=1 Tax=Aminobacter sp. MDW-2 TaxID=2666139 RepID=UPI0012AF1863|nr:ParB/Srx family N-terminal domain-containing protein [Aminobacter sp. MDW-2]MRX32834.1 hypothetical protein [Aminobacter sp. MDW-2]QNH34509.1 ParB N-terminal domain-containing protein [Aminobacter sp. MDW-2]